MGANAGIGGTYGTMPELFVKLDELINQNKIDKAKELQYKINDVIFDLISLPSLYGAAKNVISRRFGIDAGVPRSPFLPVENDEKISAIVEKIEKYVTQLNELGE